ncbi:MAG: phosphate acyltransferase PlsX [Alphaproteobacteria bacterium]|nr:phosphate acyltransferase PlsX [Alphaproteobacteria bacterium]
MANRTVIALDAMGGDHAPRSVIAGAALAAERHPELDYLIYGDEALVKPLLAQYPQLAKISTFYHTPDRVTNEIKPSIALRQGRNSSMRLAINAVQRGDATCVVSGGNTGALLAMAKFVLRTLPGIDRPAMASFVPTVVGETVMLDLGANVETDAENLVQFAMMGAIFARTVLGIPDPTIGLLNVGVEDVKGREDLRTAAAQLRDRPLPGRFVGFVEGDDIPAGTVDVVVADGFTGNVALKTLEGTAKLMAYFMRQSFMSSFMAKMGYLLARGAMTRMKHRIDPRRYNGAMFIGLEGVCVKSHGGTDHEGFANAISVAADLAAQQFNDKIKAELARHYEASEDSDAPDMLQVEAAVGSNP